MQLEAVQNPDNRAEKKQGISNYRYVLCTLSLEYFVRLRKISNTAQSSEDCCEHGEKRHRESRSICMISVHISAPTPRVYYIQPCFLFLNAPNSYQDYKHERFQPDFY